MSSSPIGEPSYCQHAGTPVSRSWLESVSLWRTWLAVFVLSFALYAATANRGAQWQDSGHRILRVVTQDVDGGLGLALSHPLHHWLGRLAAWPGWGTPALAVTLVSALAGGLAVANVYGCVRAITSSSRAGLFAAASLGIAHTFWQMATLTETYTLVAALLAGELWCLAAFLRGNRPAFLGMFLLNGLGVSNHLLAGLTTPVLLAVAVLALWNRRLPLRYCAAAAGLWLVGSLPYSTMVLAEWWRTGDFAGTMHSALFGTSYARNVLNTNITPGLFAQAVAFVVYNFPNLLLPAALLGILRARRIGVSTTLRWALLAALLIHLLFASRYDVQDQQTFFLPTYLLLSIVGGIGAACVLSWPASPIRRNVITAALVLMMLTPAVYVVTPPIVRHLQLLDRYPKKPFRDNYHYVFTPWSVIERSAEQMSRTALALAGPGGVILYEDRMGAFALKYQALQADWEGSLAPMPRLDSREGRARFMEQVQRADGTLRRTVLVPIDVRKVDTDLFGGMKWAPRDNLYVLVEPATTGPASRGWTHDRHESTTQGAWSVEPPAVRDAGHSGRRPRAAG